MEYSMLNSWPIDPAIIILALAGLFVILLVLMIVLVFQYRNLYRRYDLFMRGKNAETLEDIIAGLLENVEELQAQDLANKDAIKVLSKNVKGSYQKLGVVKYNAFKGMGGNLSFVIAMLDLNNTGIIFNSVHSREGCYLYIKSVEKGETEVLLGAEEQEALEQALEG